MEPLVAEAVISETISGGDITITGVLMVVIYWGGRVINNLVRSKLSNGNHVTKSEEVLIDTLNKVADTMDNIGENQRSITESLKGMQVLQNEMRKTQKEVGSVVYEIRNEILKQREIDAAVREATADRKRG